MLKGVIKLPLALIASLISAAGLILGSVIGGISSYIITTASTQRSLKEQIRLQEQNIKFQEKSIIKEIWTNANIVRLDICTAIYQSIRAVKSSENYDFLYIIPLNTNYHNAVSSLCEYYSLKEISYIYQLYGIIEKVNHTILNTNINNNDNISLVKQGYIDILKKVYGDNYILISKIDINVISYEDLCNSPLMKKGFRNVLNKLNDICSK